MARFALGPHLGKQAGSSTINADECVPCPRKQLSNRPRKQDFLFRTFSPQTQWRSTFAPDAPSGQGTFEPDAPNGQVRAPASHPLAGGWCTSGQAVCLTPAGRAPRADAPRETLQPRSCILPCCRPPSARLLRCRRYPATLACVPARSCGIARRTSHAPHCPRRFTPRTPGPRAAARPAAAAVGAGLAAGAARAACPPASFPRAGQAAAPSPTPAVPQNQRFSWNSPPEMEQSER